MKNLSLLLLVIVNNCIALSQCVENISFEGYNNVSNSYEPLNTNLVKPDYYYLWSNYDNYYIHLCSNYDHLKITFSSNATLSDGTITNVLILNPGETKSITIDVGQCGVNSVINFNAIKSALGADIPEIIHLPACSMEYTINEITPTGGNGPYNFSAWFITGNGHVDGTSETLPIISNVYSISSLLIQVGDTTCKIIDTVKIIPAITQSIASEICLVTMDSTNSHNLITWEKNPNMGIVSYKIFKQSTLTSQYEIVHEQPFNLISEFIDTTSKPNQEISRYKILAVDSCGIESAISSNHTTILLSSNLGNNSVNLFWNPYEGFSYSNFEIWRSLNGGVSYNLLATVANNTYAYIDYNAPQQAYYQIRISNGVGCNTSKSLYNRVKSNIVDQMGNGLGFSNYDKNDILLSPNPTNDIAYFKTNTNLIGNRFDLIEYTGRRVLSGTITENTVVNLQGLPDGIYILKVQNHYTTLKLIKN